MTESLPRDQDASAYDDWHWRLGDRPPWWSEWRIVWEFRKVGNGAGFVTNSLEAAADELKEEIDVPHDALVRVQWSRSKNQMRDTHRLENSHRLQAAAQRLLFEYCPREHRPGAVAELPATGIEVRTHSIYAYLRQRYQTNRKRADYLAEDLRWLEESCLKALCSDMERNAFNWAAFSPAGGDAFLDIPLDVLRRWARKAGLPQLIERLDTAQSNLPKAPRNRPHWAGDDGDPIDLAHRGATRLQGSEARSMLPECVTWEFLLPTSPSSTILATTSLADAVNKIQELLGPMPELSAEAQRAGRSGGFMERSKATLLGETGISMRAMPHMRYLSFRYWRHQLLRKRVEADTTWLQEALGVAAKRHTEAHADDRTIQHAIFQMEDPCFLPVSPSDAVRWAKGAPLDLIQVRNRMADE